jgi:pimeloyl-ACP methyl ester carboxylesterase
VIRDVARGRPAPAALAGVPGLLLAGARDPLLPPPEAAALARAVGAEHQQLEVAGHWPLAGPAWQEAVGRVHRWIVQRLGAPLLERYDEAMAERDAEDEG